MELFPGLRKACPPPVKVSVASATVAFATQLAAGVVAQAMVIVPFDIEPMRASSGRTSETIPCPTTTSVVDAREVIWLDEVVVLPVVVIINVLEQVTLLQQVQIKVALVVIDQEVAETVAELVVEAL